MSVTTNRPAVLPDQEVTVSKPITLTVTAELGDAAQPDAFRKAVGNVLAAHWPDIEVTVPTSTATRRETLDQEQLDVLAAGRWVLTGYDIPEDYRRGVLEMMALQMFGEPGERDRVTAYLDPITDEQAAELGRAVISRFRSARGEGVNGADLVDMITELASATNISLA